MLQIVARADWGARPPREVATISTPSIELWLHHSAGPEVGAAGVRSIQDFHMDNKGWSDIAYSFLIDPADGTVYEGRGAGIRGGHTFGHNSSSHGICVLGNFEVSALPAGLVVTVAQLVRHGHGRGWWPSQLSGGHRDVRATACPGHNLYAQISEINRLAILVDTEDPMSVKPGDVGEAVRKFQSALLNWNAQALPQFGADGDYGSETETWIRNFQQSQDLVSTGIIDGVTAALLLEFRADIVETT
ncbi:MAG: peptidoglycan-binding domain-containing protein [Actinomycetia bacterium]|nr:peptidoglycan-binding domain-containing protein [Actinomycetes bacterium]